MATSSDSIEDTHDLQDSIEDASIAEAQDLAATMDAATMDGAARPRDRQAC